MSEDRELQARFRAAIDAVPAPHGSLRRGSRSAGAFALLALPAVAAVAVAAVLVGGALSSYRADRAASGGPSASALPSAMTREQAIALVRRLDRELGHVDRIEAKLMTWEEYVKVAGAPQLIAGDPQATPMQGAIGIVGDPNKRFVWVVAVSGEVWPAGRIPIYYGGPPPVPDPSPYAPYRWGVFVVDALTAQFLTIAAAGVTGDWPPAFDRLPDHPKGPVVEPARVLASPQLSVRVHNGEATSLVMRATAVVRRIDRIEVKLMTWREYTAAAGRDALRPAGLGDDDPVWIVAVAGSVTPPSGGGSARWALFAVAAGREQSPTLLSTGASNDWPAIFDRLPDHLPLAP